MIYLNCNNLAKYYTKSTATLALDYIKFLVKRIDEHYIGNRSNKDEHILQVS